MSTGSEERAAGGDGAAGFGDLLRSLRERALLTQEELAERSGLSVRTIRRLERGRTHGRPQSGSLRRLVDALGPEAEELALLVEAAAGEPSGVPAGPPVAAVPVARQLPLAPPQFTGRDADLEALEEVRAGAGPVIIAIDGMAGIGKTAFAVHAAHRWSGRYPDGQLFLDLQGYARGVPPVDPGDALHRLLRSLGVPGPNIPGDVDDRAALYRSLLAGRRVLVLLDNAASEAQIAPLLPAASGCLVMITSRSRLTGLDVTRAHSLDLLPAEDAVTLFVRSSGRSVGSAESADRLTEVVELCGRLPLAIRLAAARLRSRPSWTAAHLVNRLRDVRSVAEFEVGDRSVAAALELSYVQLDPEQRQAYRMLGLHPGVELDVGAAAALVGRPATDAGRLVDQLLDAHLLQEPGPGRYRFHDLTRVHAARAVVEEDAESARLSALRRLVDHYCRSARRAIDAAYPYDRENRFRSPTGAIDESSGTDGAEAGAWLDTELPNLLAVVEVADRYGWPERVVELSVTMHRHLRSRGRIGNAADLHTRALAAARAAADPAGELDALNDLGHIRRLRGEREQAVDLFAAARRIARATDDRHGELNSLIGLGQVHLMQSRYPQATVSFTEVLRIASHSGDRGRELEGLLGLGWVRMAQGREAIGIFERADELARDIGHSHGEVLALSGLVRSYRLCGRPAEAVAYAERSLQVAQASGQSLGELDALIALGSLHRSRGLSEEAEVRFREALRLATEIGSGSYRFEALYGIARLHHIAGRYREAIADHERALDLAIRLGQAAEEARAHDGLAHAHHDLGDTAEARRHWQQALTILTRLGSEGTEDPEVSAASIRARLRLLDEPDGNDDVPG
ncbi:tetratricopeptide (TPR) repeat protein [Pseudonocardia hierapolitana]|uniref:Tetratricopeptide (TPR) repeat protein n=1 Tax=Pseudonocardia hierapolitana TaxID=1128676 RepID=A0A561SSC8_9PSEU|nr:helix-turn-helix domain-containing protein [Pseudonocardia hierapolitana]TWF77774.1 tetratricopeptide (TPR) repeat protein [Pseudonocardia hierapolitana]